MFKFLKKIDAMCEAPDVTAIKPPLIIYWVAVIWLAFFVLQWAAM